MKSTTRAWLMLAVLLAAVAVVTVLNSSPRPRSLPAAREPENPRARSSPRGIVQATPAEAEITDLIRGALENLRLGGNPGQAAEQLRSLRDGIRRAPEEAAAAAIGGFLKSGDDAPTGLPFAVGPDGMMTAVPSLRLALLDLLPALDPLASLALAREIMSQRTTPDEYAVSLRNTAWNDLDGDLRGELSGRFLELLETPWLERPSAGFLEAFDIAVEVGGVPMFDRMVELARDTMAKSNPAASQAAFISLDRMIVRDPAVLLTALAGDDGWMDFAPMQRASLVSRLDIADPAQRDLFLRYLTTTSHASGELGYFAKIFPNQNYLHGHRLVAGDEATPSIAEVTAADARALGALDALDALEVPGEAGAAIRMIRDRLKKTAPQH
jgi:hypothetical protein